MEDVVFPKEYDRIRVNGGGKRCVAVERVTGNGGRVLNALLRTEVVIKINGGYD